MKLKEKSPFFKELNIIIKMGTLLLSKKLMEWAANLKLANQSTEPLIKSQLLTQIAFISKTQQILENTKETE